MSTSTIINPALSANKGLQARDITVDGYALVKTPSDLIEIQMVNGVGAHEQVSITARVQKAKIDRFKDKEITFFYGPMVSQRQWFGYVVYIKPASEYKLDTNVQFVCFGTSWPMQSGKPRFLKGRTAPAVSDIVMSYDLGFQGDMDTYEWPALSQSNESDWEFITGLATRVGYLVITHDAVVRYIDPLRVLQTQVPATRLVKGDDVTDTSRQLYSFDPTSISKNARTVIKPSFGFFNGDQVTVDNPLVFPYRFESGLVIKNRDMADAYRAAWERKTEFWTHDAKARIMGNAQLLPGMVVDIDLIGPHTEQVRATTNDYGGLWLILKVAHSITNNSFQTDLSLSRPDTDAIVPANTHYRQFWAGTSKPKVLSKNDGTTKKWVSSWQTPIWNQVAA